MDYSKFTKAELLELYNSKSLTASTLADKASGPRMFDQKFIRSLENMGCRLCTGGHETVVDADGKAIVSNIASPLTGREKPCRSCNWLRHILGDLNFDVVYFDDRKRKKDMEFKIDIPKLVLADTKEEMVAGLVAIDTLIETMQNAPINMELTEKEFHALKWGLCTNCSNKIGAQDSDNVKYCEICQPARDIYLYHRDNVFA